MRSMTGCGSGKVSSGGWEVTVDLKTVNHRFLDIGLRLPRNLSFLELPVREMIGKIVRRGHVDVYITVSRSGSSSRQVTCDPELAFLYCEAAGRISERTGVRNDLTVSSLLSMEGVLNVSEADLDEEAVTAACVQAASIACEQVSVMREMEGLNLKTHLSEVLVRAEELKGQILARAPMVVDEYREKLENRMKALVKDGVDEQRIAQEVAIIADRCSIDEELARLGSHFLQMKRYLDSEGEIGKKMDFLIQEMNRETNTIGSKASDAVIAQCVVDLKSEIEKLREQIQNVE